ncbi:hypothetical protein Q31a_24760 [Aureliella helgolandensis]|uniref:Uncharacterized protein n=1 Tax=Aureliella helgolandensis TaxID=2527968 RepID=A0A518G6F1_9BACT|nr:hypothetical protein Q31a_24760 [Aureliella helgolandensis]
MPESGILRGRTVHAERACLPTSVDFQGKSSRKVNYPPRDANRFLPTFQSISTQTLLESVCVSLDRHEGNGDYGWRCSRYDIDRRAGWTSVLRWETMAIHRQILSLFALALLCAGPIPLWFHHAQCHVSDCHSGQCHASLDAHGSAHCHGTGDVSEGHTHAANSSSSSRELGSVSEDCPLALPGDHLGVAGTASGNLSSGGVPHSHDCLVCYQLSQAGSASFCVQAVSAEHVPSYVPSVGLIHSLACIEVPQPPRGPPAPRPLVA